MREQFEVLGMDTFDRRGAATDEAIRLFRAVWAAGAEVSFTGEVYHFEPVRFLPKPAQPGGPPIWVGGNGARSLRRAAALGDGWHPVRIGVNELRTGVATLRELLDRNGRQSVDVMISGKFRLYSPGTGPLDKPHESELIGRAEQIAEKIKSYQDAGLQYLVLDPTQHSTSAEAFEAIEFFAHEVRPLLD
jgi:alkanesulfonate monooxygenase SsuD/methylene tetrahydromethanopterin reductase-like flavin-dependent oxidoreductase (luciferase family)